MIPIVWNFGRNLSGKVVLRLQTSNLPMEMAIHSLDSLVQIQKALVRQYTVLALFGRLDFARYAPLQSIRCLAGFIKEISLVYFDPEEIIF